MSIWAVLLAAVVAGAALAVVGSLAVALVPTVLAGALMLTQPLVGLLALVLTIPFEAAVMTEGGATVTRLLGMGVAGLWFAGKVLRGGSWRPVLTTPFAILSVLFLALAGLSAVWAEYPANAQSGAVRLVMFLALALMVVDLLRTWHHALWLVRVLVVGGGIAATMVLVQYFGLGTRRAGGDVAGGINSTAMALVTLLPFGFVLIRSRSCQHWRLVGLVFVMLALVAVAVTFSRMSFLLVPLVLAFEGWETLRKGRGRTAAAILVVLALLATVRFIPLEDVRERVATIGPYIEATLSGRTPEQPTLSGRGYHLYVALTIFRDHPVVGVGYDNFGQHFLRYQLSVPGSDQLYRSPRSAHSSFAAILADLGVVGIALWLLLLGTVLWNLSRTWRYADRDRSSLEFLVTRAVLSSLVLMLAYGFYSETHQNKLFWVILGMAVMAHQLVTTKSSRDFRPQEASRTPRIRVVSALVSRQRA